MKDPVGRKCWAIAEGYILGRGQGPGPEMTSHETACLLNVISEAANAKLGKKPGNRAERRSQD